MTPQGGHGACRTECTLGVRSVYVRCLRWVRAVSLRENRFFSFLFRDSGTRVSVRFSLRLRNSGTQSLPEHPRPPRTPSFSCGPGGKVSFGGLRVKINCAFAPTQMCVVRRKSYATHANCYPWRWYFRKHFDDKCALEHARRNGSTVGPH